MKDGMKKFTKGCLLTALVVFIVGCGICCVCAVLGGFRQLRGLNVRYITGIPFFYHRNSEGGFSFGFTDDDQEYWDAEWEQHEGWDQVDGADRIQLSFTADTLRNLDIAVGASKLFVEESEDDYVWLAVSGDTRYFRYHEENDGTLSLVRREDSLFWNWIGERERDNTTEIHLYLPAETYLNDIDIMMGAGVMNSIALRAHNIKIEAGACVCSIDGLEADGHAEVRVGAGQIRLQSFATGEADLEIGAGELYIEDARITKEVDINIGMGTVEVSGLISGDLDADCSMGNLTLNLEDGEQNHNYEIDCSMGNVRIGSTSYTGLSDGKVISNGSKSTYEIDCSMGNVNVSFAQ